MKNIEPVVVESAEGYTCVVTFNNNSGARCGYIFVPEADKAFVSKRELSTYSFSGKKEDEHTIDVTYSKYDIEIHGGLTYGSTNKASEPNEYPIVIKQDGIWLGFDANHYNDSPDNDVWETLLENENDRQVFDILKNQTRIIGKMGETTIRSEEFMMKELESASHQLSIMTEGKLNEQNDD